MSSVSPHLKVFVTDNENARRASRPKERPAHWDNDSPVWFNNPWPSWAGFPLLSWESLSFFTKSYWRMFWLKTNHADTSIPFIKPTWGVSEDETASSKIRATWLGHACFHVQMPGSSQSRGANILFDPVFSSRCSPTQYLGPKRYTPPPCNLEEIPVVDAVIISHNHYDHLDTDTITILAKRSQIPHFFAPLGNEDWFMSLGIPKSHVHILDWWESLRLESTEDKFAVDITCTPSQHQSGRSTRDQRKTLWSSWVVEGAPTADAKGGGGKVYFAGDTGYRAVKDANKLDDESLPYCPAFNEIGEKWQGFDFAMIPIGAYQPRVFTSSQHASPPQSVHIFKDVRARNALAMHWGTWVLTSEEILEPPQLLRESLAKHGIAEERFTTCGIGETRAFNVEQV